MSAHTAHLRPEERLARSAPGDVEAARALVTDLLGAARALAHVTPVDGLTDPDGLRLLAARLATVPGVTSPGDDDASLAECEAAFRRALLASLPAVRTCRQQLHVSGACWFADVPGRDGCGQLLHAAHRLS